MANKLSRSFINLTIGFIGSESTKQKFRMNKNDFIRERKLSFETLCFCLIKLLKQNLQLELNTYFRDANGLGSKKQLTVTSSAFVQSRKKIRPEMFYELNRLIAEDFYQDNDENVELYKGHRLLSVDGSAIDLPINEGTREFYGTHNNHTQTNDVVLGRVSIMYDLLNEMVIDGRLCPFHTGEVPLAREHIKEAKEGDIIIMDRAYPSFESIYEMQKKGIHFIFRCKQNFSNKVTEFFESKKKDAVIEIKPGQHRSFKDLPYNKEETLLVRMIKIRLSTGETEILMTSLLDKAKYPYGEFKKLYSKRWVIETYYNRFKNIIGVENFSGTSDQFIQQEFNCALYMSNMQSILTKEAQKEVNQKYQNRKYQYKINASLSLCFIRQRLMQMFTSNKDSDEILEELKQLFILNVIPIRPNRKFPRDHAKYRNRTKPKQFNNRRTIL